MQLRRQIHDSGSSILPIKKQYSSVLWGRRSPAILLIGTGGGQDFLATGHGRWYRSGPSDHTTGVDEKADGFANGYRSH
jgi:hypothetical protein